MISTSIIAFFHEYLDHECRRSSQFRCQVVCWETKTRRGRVGHQTGNHCRWSARRCEEKSTTAGNQVSKRVHSLRRRCPSVSKYHIMFLLIISNALYLWKIFKIYHFLMERCILTFTHLFYLLFISGQASVMAGNACCLDVNILLGKHCFRFEQRAVMPSKANRLWYILCENGGCKCLGLGDMDAIVELVLQNIYNWYLYWNFDILLTSICLYISQGVHYPDDNIAGMNLSQEVLAKALPQYLKERYNADPIAVAEKISQNRFDWRDFDPNDPCAA